jgi:hypothetical protein
VPAPAAPGRSPGGNTPDLLQGTLDMLILKALSIGPMHGYGILLRIQHCSKAGLEIQQGSLTRPFTASSTRASCRANGGPPTTTAVPSSTR